MSRSSVIRYLVGLGFTALLTQVLLIREAGLWLRGNEFVVATIVATWLAWIATGSLIGYRLSGRGNGLLWMRVNWYASVVISVIELVLLRCFWTYTGGLSGESINLGRAALLALGATALPCLLSGSAFGGASRWVEGESNVECRMSSDDFRVSNDECGAASEENGQHGLSPARGGAQHSGGHSVAWLYLWETIGAVMAGVLVTFVLIPIEHWWFSLAALLCAPVVAGCTRSMGGSERLRPEGSATQGAPSQMRARRFMQESVLGTLLVVAVLCGAWFGNGGLERGARGVASRFLVGDVVLDSDTPRERITVTSRGGEAAFYINGRLVGSSVQRERAEEESWYGTLCVDHPKRALLIGFPYNGLLREMVQKGIAVTVLDPEQRQIKKMSPFLLAQDRAALTSSLVRILPVDSRTFLRRRAHGRGAPFDVIMQNAGIPESYAVGRLYSREWFEDLSRSLSSNGVLTVVLPGSSGYVPEDLARILARVRTTMRKVFRHVTIIPASSTLLLASQGVNVPDTAIFWGGRWKERRTNTWWFNAALIEDNLNEFRIAQFSNACARLSHIQQQTDRIPRSYGDALQYSEARFAGYTHRLLSLLYNNPRAVLIVAIIAACAWVAAAYASGVLGWARTNTWLVMTAFSATGFVAEMTVLIRFVLLRGSLFYSIGLLFAGFMLGLAIATYMGERFADVGYRVSPRQERGRGFGCRVSGVGFRVSGFGFPNVLFLIAGVVLSGAAWVITMAPWPSQPFIVLLFAFGLNVVCGLCVGACFAVMARLARRRSGGGVALYAADLCGALIGGLLFSVVVPPVLGFVVLLGILCGTMLLVALLFRQGASG